MKRKIALLALWSVLLLALGGTIESILEHGGQQQNTGSQSRVILLNGNIYVGDLDMTEGGTPPVVDVEEKDTGEFIVNGKLYKQYQNNTGPIDFFHTISSSSWYMDMSQCSIIGKTQDGIEVIAPTDENPLVILLRNIEEQTAVCLMRPDIIEEGVSVFDLDDFDVYWDGEFSADNTRISALWEFHTGYQEYPIASPMLDGDWEIHRVTMVLKESPALIYEFKLGICEEYLYIKNLNCQYTICVSLN